MNDLNQIIEIHKSTLNRGKASNFPNFIFKLWYNYQLKLKNNQIIIHRSGKNIIGFILYDISNKEILVMCVRKGFQGLGIGSLLINKIKEPCRVTFDCKHIQSIRFYEKNGFKIKRKLGVFNYIDRVEAVKC